MIERLHASCVSIEGRGVLLLGPSGAGKSDVALRLIDGGAKLVSDDQTEVRLEKNVLIAAAPEKLAGLLEIRSVGLARMEAEKGVPLALAVDLAQSGEALERMPETSFLPLLGQQIRKVRLPGLAASTPAVIRAVLKGIVE